MSWTIFLNNQIKSEYYKKLVKFLMSPTKGKALDITKVLMAEVFLKLNWMLPIRKTLVCKLHFLTEYEVCDMLYSIRKETESI